MNILKYIAIFAGLLILQIVILPFFSVLEIIPNVILIGIIVLAFNEGTVAAMIAGAISGLVYDAFSTRFLGASMLGFVLGGFFTGVIFKQREKMNFQLQTFYLFAIILFYHLLYYSLYLLDKKLSLLVMIFRFAIPASIYTLVALAITHFLIPRGIWR